MNRATILTTISEYGDTLLAAGRENDFEKRTALLNRSFGLYTAAANQLRELEELARNAA